MTTKVLVGDTRPKRWYTRSMKRDNKESNKAAIFYKLWFPFER